MKKRLLTSAIESALLTTAIGLTALPVIAQEQAEEEAKPERISVTGSRISRVELTTPTPTLTIGTEDIARFDTPDLGSLLAELPAIGATDTLGGNSESNASAGLSSADLRRLGANRTLVLVNGKRHVAGAPGSAQVDISTIPAALVERVEITTGGASAIYGSDAVTGVINVILKRNFTGLELSAKASDSLEGVANENRSFNLIAGTDYSDGQGNVTFFIGQEHFGQQMNNDIRQLDNWGTIVNPADGGEDDGISDRLRVPYVGSEMINRSGVLNPFSPDRVSFDRSGNVRPSCERIETNSFAFGSFEPGCDVFLTDDYINRLPEVDRTTIGSTLYHQFNDEHSFYADIKYSNADIIQQFQPGFRFGNITIDIAANPYLPQEARDAFGGEGTTSFAKFFDEIGNRNANNERETLRYVAGFEGVFTLGGSEFDYDIFYVNGETKNVRMTENDIIPGNVAAAIDAVINPATGQADCRANVPSAQGEGYTSPATVDTTNCVPYNPFGFAQASAEAMDWVSADTTREDTIKQVVYGGSVASNTEEFFTLPAGGIGYAFGLEHRTEEYETLTDPLTQSDVLTGAATPDEFGEYDVTEWFIEVSVPLVADAPGVKELTLDAAFRGADYSHAGDADAWKVGLMWVPVEDLRLRATHSVSVRAPNLGEAFSPLSPGFGRVSDPCDADNINDDPDRAANCAALGMPAGFEANDNVSINTLSGGNENLFSEESTSSTYGLVYTPSFLEDFSITMDYYEIEIKDAIISVASQDIADNCVDATGGPDEVYCSAVDRNADTFDIELVRSGFLNAAAFNVAGVETDIRYVHDMTSWGLDGKLVLNVFVSKLLELERFEFQDRPDEINVEIGEVGDPKWQFRSSVSYVTDNFMATWSTRYVDRVVTYDVSPGGGSPEDTYPGWVPSMHTHDLSMTYQITDNFEVNGGVRNVFDKLPVAYVENDIYDAIGRRMFVGVKYSM
jgi:outer membrane receptor protein involved in Fe transport